MSHYLVCLNVWCPECGTESLMEIKTEAFGNQGKQYKSGDPVQRTNDAKTTYETPSGLVKCNCCDKLNITFTIKDNIVGDVAKIIPLVKRGYVSMRKD